MLSILLCTSVLLVTVSGETATPKLVGKPWPAGLKQDFKMDFTVTMLKPVKGGWTMDITFSEPVVKLQQWRGKVVKVSTDKKVYTIKNLSWNRNFKKCEQLYVDLIGRVASGVAIPTATIELKRAKGGDDNLDSNACPTITTKTVLPQTTTTRVTQTKGPTTPAVTYPTAIPTSELTAGETSDVKIKREWWPTGFGAEIKIQILAAVNDGWKIKLEFSEPIKQLKIWRASIESVSADKKVYWVKSLSWNDVLQKCSLLKMSFMAQKISGTPIVSATLYRVGTTNVKLDPAACPATTPAPTTSKPTTTKPESSTTEAVKTTDKPEATTPNPVTVTKPSMTTPNPAVTTDKSMLSTTQPTGTKTPEKYDYNLVLHDSILFYEAQRSGKLPSNNRVPWRKDSALDDGKDVGVDLTGGWYDAGDFVKFGFPMAASATVLAWGLIEYRSAYQAAGELDNVLDSIKWATDYFIKAHTKKFEFYGQVGDGNADHAFWGRPEDMTMARPSFKITTSKPGSELAAETAAALAATSIAFRQTDPVYAAELLKHAEELYEFADKYRGKYSDAITNAQNFYNSFGGYNDELVWGAAWLYRATKKPDYLTKAETYYDQFNLGKKAWGFSWDDKTAGAQLLLAQITGKDKYKNIFEAFLNDWLPGGSVQYTPKGLAWLDKWGANRYAANSAFLALVGADIGIKPVASRLFAKKQIDYMLGDAGRSFVVGFGNNPPTKPHHRSSTCPLAPKPCGWNEYNSNGPNANVLVGALVGGPDNNGNYADSRSDYIMNEVTTDYNAGFQSAVAGIKKLHL